MPFPPRRPPFPTLPLGRYGPWVLALLVTACGGRSAQETARAQSLFATCAPCHGAAAGGDPGRGVPNLAGLPEWYVELQLWEFQVGYRAYQPGDTLALRMAAMARSLPDAGDPSLLADYIARMPAVSQAATVKGNVAEGKVAYQACIACHELDGSGRRDKNAPPLIGLADWYVADQLRRFRDGERGMNPNDQLGGTMMRPVSIPLDDADIRNLAAYVATLR